MDLAISSIEGASSNSCLAFLPPTGSFSAGNISPPQIDHADTAVTIPANATYSVNFQLNVTFDLDRLTKKGVTRLHRPIDGSRHLGFVFLRRSGLSVSRMAYSVDNSRPAELFIEVL